MRDSMRYLLLLLVLGIPQAWAGTPAAPAVIEGVKNLTAEEVVEQILREPSLVIIDARKSELYARGHIQNAINLLDTRITPALLTHYAASKETPLLFYCNGPACMRSSNALMKAQEWGYHRLYWFRGGWVEWTKKKLPIER